MSQRIVSYLLLVAGVWLCLLAGHTTALAQARPNPNLKNVKTDIKNVFTFKRRCCKIVNIYSGVAKGTMVVTRDWGEAPIDGYVIRKKKVYFYRYVKNDLTEKKKVVKKIRAIKNLKVLAPKNKDAMRGEGGKPRMKRIKLSAEESKSIMITELIKRNNVKWIVLLYPEERENLQQLLMQQQDVAPPDTPAMP